MPSYIVITGGVMSGLGKGILSASIGRLLKSCGYKLTLVKIDPYLNIDAGTLSPFEHGEVFVLDDGAEVDLDFGHYERFIDDHLDGAHNITTGKVYSSVVQSERNGDYLGRTVQIVPHVTNKIKEMIRSAASGSEITIVEIGGTVGDIEGLPFIEAIRQLKKKERMINIHLTYLPTLGTEQKTKPTQHSVITLRSLGILPDIIVGRSKKRMTRKVKKKITLFCDVEEEAVIDNPDLPNVYVLPLELERAGLHRIIQKKLGLEVREPKLGKWAEFVSRVRRGKKVVIGIVGKYGKGDTYLSIQEALTHAGAALGLCPEIKWIDSELIEIGELEPLDGIDAMITPGGFGSRGVQGKIDAIKFARENHIPWLGLCYGFQLAAVEFARNVLGLEHADSKENSPDTPDPVIIPHWEARQDVLGGTMRLGLKRVELAKGSMVQKVYRKTVVHERHRHRYGLNPEYRSRFERAGMRFTGLCPDDETVEVLELPGQFFIGVQFHPEYKSRPLKPHPLFVGLLKHAVTQ